MKADKYIIPENKKTYIRKLPVNSKEDNVEKEDIIAKYEANKQSSSLCRTSSTLTEEKDLSW